MCGVFFFSEAPLESDNGAVTGPPGMIVHSLAAEARLFQSAHLRADTRFMRVYVCESERWESYWQEI